MWTCILAAALGAISTVSAQASTTENGITYSVSVPDQVASSGNGDIYIQISGPTTNSWIGFGQGSLMSGAKMFVIYASASGNNVTLSPRKGNGHSQPSFDSSAQVALLQGSGISGGVMTANIRCSDCKDLNSTSSSWVYAARAGSPLQNDSQSASIQQHSNMYGTVLLDMSIAKGGPVFGADSASSTTSAGSTIRETITATATTTSTAAPSSGLRTGTKVAIAVPFAVIFLLLLGGLVYWKQPQRGHQEDYRHSSRWRRSWARMKGRESDHHDPNWEKAEIDGNEVEPSELEGVRVHELYGPPRVHQLDSSDRPVELQG